MIEITHKHSTLRKAIAEASLVTSLPETIQAVRDRKVPKGDVLESARIAALFGVKKTSDLIPDCHPLPVEHTAVRFELSDYIIRIEVEVHTVYKTGVEVEAMHGASIAALTMYDMLKPIDKGIEIQRIRLMEKKGGKSNYNDRPQSEIKAAVVVCSDTISAGRKEDAAGKAIIGKLKSCGLEEIEYCIIPDEKEMIQSEMRKHAALKTDLLIFCGGTGLSPRDVSPESVAPLLEREIPGIMEAARQYGQQRTPYAMLSRGIAGMMGDMLVITLPGSTRGASESMDALFPYLLHIFNVSAGKRHDK